MKRQSKMFRAAMETLEARQMLFAAGLIGDTLFLQGSNGPDVVTVSDNGSQIDVTETFSSFHQTFSTSGVASILVTVGAGSDQVAIPQSSTRPISAFLGSDNDIALIGSGANYRGNITFHGEDGADLLQVFDNSGTTGKTYRLFDGGYEASNMPAGGYVSFDNIENVQLFDARGNDTVNVIGVTSYSTYEIISDGGFDTVTVGDGRTDAVTGGVLLKTTQGTMNLIVDDTVSDTARSIGVNMNNLTGLAPGTINWATANITEIALRASNAANTWTVNNTPTAPTALFGGDAQETFNVVRTSGPLNVNGGLGFDHVTVGNDLRQINGVLNLSAHSGSALQVTLNDSLDSVARNIAITQSAGTDTFLGLSPYPITTTFTQEVNIVTGTGWDAATIFSNQATLKFDSAGGNDTVNIGDGDDPLFNVLSGEIYVANNAGGGARSIVYVHDEGDVQSRNVNIVTDSFNTGYVDIFGIAYYNFSFRPDQVASVQINGSAGASTYAIAATANGTVPMTINGGSNADTFTVTGTNGALRLNGGGGVDTFTVNGNNLAFPVTIDSGASNDIVNVNTDNSGSASAVFSESLIQLGEIHVGNGGRATVSAGGGRLLYLIGTLEINPINGVLDLSDNDMLHQTGISSYAQDQELISSARNGGAWNGAGISSSAAGANPKHNTTLGAMTGADYATLFNALGTGAKGVRGTPDVYFDGQIASPSATLIKYTYYGDTDFNGTVNFDDYSRTDAGFNAHRTGWLTGDFNNNGVVNFDDYAYIDLSFNTQAGVL